MATPTKHSQEKPIPMSTFEIEKAFSKLGKKTVPADLIIECEGRAYELHRDIVYDSDKFFRAAHLTDRIKIAEDTTLVRKMFTFLYTGHYPSPRHRTKGSPSFMLHAQMYVLGYEYGIERLKEYAKGQYCSCAYGRNWYESSKEIAESVAYLFRSIPKDDGHESLGDEIIFELLDLDRLTILAYERTFIDLIHEVPDLAVGILGNFKDITDKKF